MKIACIACIACTLRAYRGKPGKTDIPGTGSNTVMVLAVPSRLAVRAGH
jgi:hypothetical protein